MATLDPDPELLRIQLDSLRAQTETSWVCLISDDCSRPDRFREVERHVADDPRFTISRSQRRRGFYRNFERCLQMLPAEAELVALCDQDDRWYPEKLATLRLGLGDAQLVYSDQRLVDRDGRVLADTYWSSRRNNYTNLVSLLVANTVTGAASLCRREVIDRALPFPETPGEQYHDHWLALVAMASGRIAYIDRPLYDYVQHGGAALGHAAANAGYPPSGRRGLARIRGWRQTLRDWRWAYLNGYLRLKVLAEALLSRCSGSLEGRKCAALRRFVGAERSPLGFVWLALRPLRRLLGRNETLGYEKLLARGILWRHLSRIGIGPRIPR